MWKFWRVLDPRKAIILTGLMIAFVSTSIHLIHISGDRYSINTWSAPLAEVDKATRKVPSMPGAAQNAPIPSK